jgi:hypothetical protein
MAVILRDKFKEIFRDASKSKQMRDEKWRIRTQLLVSHFASLGIMPSPSMQKS